MLVEGTVAEETSAKAVVEQLLEQWGQIDILVNNAAAPGGIARGPLATISDDDVLEDLNTKVVGYLRCARAVGPFMTDQGWGRIINIASIWGREHGGNISYMSAKAALIGATKHAGLSLAGDGILVNSIAPGSIAHAEGSWERFQNENPPDVVASFIEQNLPMGKFG
ncbi:MAG: SDR family oxidoreductase, partial [Proteobacteria bacterium]|nr:SDR family oxidoreductase [Pseudomonadota bacterium]